jgi:hypothetical protein
LLGVLNPLSAFFVSFLALGQAGVVEPSMRSSIVSSSRTWLMFG